LFLPCDGRHSDIPSIHQINRVAQGCPQNKAQIDPPHYLLLTGGEVVVILHEVLCGSRHFCVLGHHDEFLSLVSDIPATTILKGNVSQKLEQDGDAHSI
jgi:hypothetical protein